MRFFFIFFAIATAICGYFWLTDGPGSGMVWPTCLFAAIAVGTGIYNWRKNGSSLNDKASGGRLNSFALPMLLAVQLTFSAWWLVAAGLVILWLWAITRPSDGGYFSDFTRSLCIILAFLVTAGLAAGYGLAHLLHS